MRKRNNNYQSTKKNGYSPNKLRVTEEEITEAVITTTTEAALEVTEMTEK